MAPYTGLCGFGGGSSGLNVFGKSAAVHYGDRGIHGGGNTHDLGGLTVMYFSITSTGNASDFGDLTDARYFLGGCADGSLGRATWGGGRTPGATNIIDYLTISTTGNASDFGDLSQSRHRLSAACDATTDRGFYFGGDTGGALSDRIDYITLASTGNATDTGNLSYAARHTGSAANSLNSKVYCFCGAANISNNWTGSDYIQVILDASTGGNSYDYGNATQEKEHVTATSNNERAIVFGGSFTNGNVLQNTIEYLTLDGSVGGNCSDFGDLDAGKRSAASMANKARACCAGGYTGSNINVIEYITIDTTGDASDFGDLADSRAFAAAMSGD